MKKSIDLLIVTSLLTCILCIVVMSLNEIGKTSLNRDIKQTIKGLR